MAGNTVNVVALAYSSAPPNAPANYHTLNSFGFTKTQNSFQTISQNIAKSGADIEGLVFVPTFNDSDRCHNLTAPYVPQNITTLNQLPTGKQFALIAYAPWSNDSSCVLSYLDAANAQDARAFVTYLPWNVNRGNPSAAAAPNSSDPVWSLGNGGAWMNNYGFPVYALNSNDGDYLTTELALYSGNTSTTPNIQPSDISNLGSDPSVRLYMQVLINNMSPLPSLWVFLLIVVAVLVGVLLLSSIVMRVVQRRRRRELRALIANGEVNMEMLGIGRVKVTHDVLDKMPLYIYVAHGESPEAPHAPPPENPDGVADEEAGVGMGNAQASAKRRRFALSRDLFTRGKNNAQGGSTTAPRTRLPSILEEKAVSFPQDTCVICIDEFENHVTAVRWLPCGHAFHPACIDPLLLEYSSLCPTCKQSVLPKDYVPEVTNVMVRRQRLMNRLRQLEARERAHEDRFRNGPAHFRGIGRFLPRLNDGQSQNGTARRTSEAAGASAPVEMQNMRGSGSNVGNSNNNNNNNATIPSPTPADTTVTGNGEADTTRPSAAQRNASTTSAPNGDEAARRPEGVSREEWARQRAEALVGTNETVEEAEQREERRMPFWRRALGPIFPTLRS